MNTISGLPRAGSTLLANILNQNPKNKAVSTSILGLIVNTLSTVISNQPETIGSSINDKKHYDKIKDSTRAFIDKWNDTDKVVWDKGRGWCQQGLIYQDLYPKGKMVVLVRDLRDVFASMDKQHRKNPMLAPSTIIPSQNLWDRATVSFADTGILGMCIRGVEDLINRKLKNILFVRYEDFVKDPKKVMESIDPGFEYDFEDVVNTADDVDELYANKYPHKGSGKVGDESIGMWKEYMTNDVSEEIMKSFPIYNRSFDYAN